MPKWKQGLLLLLGVLRSFWRLAAVISADFVFIHREVMPIGPPVIEWIAARVFRKKIIYDFDDAIWLTDNTNEPFFERIVRWRSKVRMICRWSYKVSCGNAYLADYARQANTNVVINPTTIDPEGLHNPHLFDRQKLRASKGISGIVIGWTGSHSTLKYLEAMEPVLIELEIKYPQVTWLVIADRPPALKLNNLVFCRWTKETEIKDLILADVGIMPLPDDQWAKGKCGFKALQYMSLGIPAVVSPVGVNSSIILHGVNGFCCSEPASWKEVLATLLLDEKLRATIGAAGRQTVVNHYSVTSNEETFLSFFQ